MLRDINRYLQGEAPVIKAPPPDDETLASRHAQIVARIATVKQQWRDAVGEGRDAMLRGYAEMEQRLGDPGAPARAAAEMVVRLRA